MELMLRIPTNLIRFRKEFHSAKKLATESMTDWYHRLKQLSEQCNYGSYLEVFVLDQFVIGLDDMILDRLCAVQDDLSLTNIIELGSKYEFDKEDVDIKPEPVVVMVKQETISDFEPFYDHDYSSDDHNDADDNHEIDVQPTVVLAPSTESIALPSFSGNLKLFECYLCHKTFSTVGHLSYHFAGNHTIGKTMKCHLCGKWIRDPSNMVRHLNRHFDAKPYACNICDFSCVRSDKLSLHISKHSDPNLQVYNCSRCDKKFISTRQLRKHEKTHDTPTITISQKFDEILRKRKLMKAKSKAATQFKCEICSESLDNESMLNDHMKFHCETEWLCHLCGKKLKNKRNLMYHYRIHDGIKPFNCEHCDKVFSCKEKQKLHAKIHSNNMPHVCSICNRSFLQKGHLVSHIKSHSVQDKEFKCDKCPRQFSDQSKFEIHLRVHAGLKAYPCSTCDKSFKSPSHRKEHEIIHTGEKPYQCFFCNKRFAQRSTLSGHLKWHAKPPKPPKSPKPKKSKKKLSENILPII